MRLHWHCASLVFLMGPLLLGAGPAVTPGSIGTRELPQSVSDAREEPDPAEGAPGLHGKGGRQNIDNEFVSEARKQADPCAWLAERYSTEKSAANKLKLQAAQKALGCRNKQKRQSS
ncbi:hypothetical protein ACLESO_15945 [Pyxidicoccus sp. 3LG]